MVRSGNREQTICRVSLSRAEYERFAYRRRILDAPARGGCVVIFAIMNALICLALMAAIIRFSDYYESNRG